MNTHFVPEKKPLELNFIVIDNAKLIKENNENTNSTEPVSANNPTECLEKCTKIGTSRCNIIEYNHENHLCNFYDLPKDVNSTLKFKFSDKELKGESFSNLKHKKIKKENITKDECIKMFESYSDSIFYHYRQDDSYNKCIVGIPIVDNNYSFGINLNSFNTKLKYVDSKIKYSYNPDELSNKNNLSEQQNIDNKNENIVPIILDIICVIGILIIIGLLYYGITLIKKTNKLAEKSKNTIDQFANKIKSSESYNHYKMSHFSKNFNIIPNKAEYFKNSTISNIAPKVFDYNDYKNYKTNFKEFYSTSRLSSGSLNFNINKKNNLNLF